MNYDLSVLYSDNSPLKTLLNEKSFAFRQKIKILWQQFQELEKFLSKEDASKDPDFNQKLKEYGKWEFWRPGIQSLASLDQDYLDCFLLLNENNQDSDLKILVEEEWATFPKRLEEKELELRALFLPGNEDDERNIIMELHAGTGGEEAALFVALLARMYKRYGEIKGWTVEILHESETEHGGYREIQMSITGKNVYGCLKFEGGVHRVQRVPETEASGRVHTSTASISVLPEAHDIDIHIEDKDIRIDVFRSSGPGGQSVNTTDSAVRITHIPTGIVVQQQDEKSQHKNKAKALKILRARLYEQKRQEQELIRAKSRASQVGRAERCERIRTYNFPQNRLTDHRFKLTFYSLSLMVNGEGLQELFDSLKSHDRLEKIMENE